MSSVRLPENSVSTGPKWDSTDFSIVCQFTHDLRQDQQHLRVDWDVDANYGRPIWFVMPSDKVGYDWVKYSDIAEKESGYTNARGIGFKWSPRYTVNRDAEDRPSMFAAVHPDDRHLVELGIGFGITPSSQIKWIVRLPRREGLTPYVRTMVDNVIAGAWTYTPGAEAKMVEQFRLCVKEAVLERIGLVLKHWAFRVAPYSVFEAAKESVGSEFTENEMARIENFIIRHRPSRLKAYYRACLRMVAVEQDIDARFAPVKTMVQAEQAASNYFAGTFGEDYWLRGFWKRTSNPKKWALAERFHEDGQRKLAYEKLSLPLTYVAGDALAPLWKNFPELLKLDMTR